MSRRQGKPILFVPGSNGLLGQKMVAVARRSFWTVGADIGDTSLSAADEYLSLDITHGDVVLETLRRISPTAVVNTAALTNVDACEKEKDTAWAINVEGVRFLQQGCQRVGAMMVQLSSDYVFDGQAGPYDEDAQPHPIGFYGITKLESERIMAASRSPWAVVRTNVLYGWAQGIRANFALWVYSHLASKKYIRVAIDQYGNPTLADDLAEGICSLLAKGRTGVFHIAGRDYVSRWAFALKIARFFGLHHEYIAPVLSSQLSQRASRPHWGGLRVEKTARVLGLTVASIQEGLEVLKTQLPNEETGVK